MSNADAERTASDYDIAVIGMAGRFPGARDVDEFWRNLRAGVEGISFFTDEELEEPRDPSGLNNPAYIKAHGVLEGVEHFDAHFFNVPAREAEWLDPQQRLFMECAWSAIEDAGYSPESFDGLVSVYAGLNANTYILSRLDRLGVENATEAFLVFLSSDKDHLATRVSYKLNLRGESITVQTACSTSLVATHLACQSLLSGQSDMALAGGVSVRFPQKTGYFYTEGMIMSPDGHCRAFDRRAQGTLSGNGLAVLTLRRMADAVAAGDHVYAVIKGSAVNNDGRMKIGYTAPSVEGQADVIARALAMAGVEPQTIGFVEAHGTGTAIGDPIEVEALTRVYRRYTGGKNFCALGSVKSNIGHLDNAAGVAGMVKAVKALEQRVIPPTLHFTSPNPALDLENSPFFVNTEPVEWKADHTPRRAGVSSFGIGGTNAHVILEEAPPRHSAPPSRPWQVITLSAKTKTAARSMAERLAGHLEAHADLNLADVAYTQCAGRQTFSHRRFVVARDAAGAVAALREPSEAAGAAQAGARVVFMFPGQGAQAVGMGREIYDTEPNFRTHLDACARLVEERCGYDLRRLLYPAAGGEEAAASRLAQPEFTLPALFAFDYALAQLWMSWGFKAEAMIGHSFGEYVAACLAEVLSLEDALALAVGRGRLMQRLPPGAMLAVRSPAEEVRGLLNGELEVASVNSAESCVVAGSEPAVERFGRLLEARQVGARRLNVPFAYHTAMLDPLLPEFADLVAGFKLNRPALPYVSGVTGTWAEADEVTGVDYWVRQMRRTVLFAGGLETLAQDTGRIFLEVGPGRTLTTLAKQHLGRGRLALPSLGHRPGTDEDGAVMLRSLGEMWAAGAGVDWAQFYGHARRCRLSLPTYPFERDRYWIEPSATGTQAAAQTAAAPAPARRAARHAVQRDEPLSDSEVPADEVEAKLAEVWGEVLGLEGVGPRDNFYDLGGDSLLATRVYTRVKQSLAAEVTLEQVMTHLTVAELAAAIRESAAAAAENPSRDGASPYAAITPVPRDRELPLSYAQEWLWSLDQLMPNNPAYNITIAMRLQGRLDAGALEQSINDIVRRHEVLRTTFPAADGKPSQVIHDEVRVSLARADLGASPDPEQEARRILTEEVRRPFVLAEVPLLRASLLRLAEEDHVFILILHHIVTDAWSSSVLIDELTTLYRAHSERRPPALPPLPIQYADFASWQREVLSGEKLEELLSYWTRQLAGAPPVLNLPFARPRPAAQSLHSARQMFALPSGLTAALKSLSRGEGVTLFMTLLAGFQTLLYRHTGQADITVGSPIAGRSRAETEGLIGCFINTLPLRTDLSGNPRFRELLGRVREVAFGAYSHQELPFERMVAALRPERSRSYMPLFQVLFDLINAPPAEPVELEGLTLSPLEGEASAGKLDIMMGMWESEGELRGFIEYRTDLFEAADISRVILQLEQLLNSAVEQPDARLDALEMYTEDERRQQADRLKEREAANRRKFMQSKPKAIKLPTRTG